jgi:hypothetical protein
MTRSLILILFAAGSAHGQVFQVSGGASSLFQADGGSVSYLTGDTRTDAGVGLAQGHLVFGADFHVQLHHCEAVFGDYQEYFATAGEGLAVVNRGAALICKDKRQAVRFFAGATGDLHAAPFFTGMDVSHFGFGVEFQRTVTKGLELTAVAAVIGNERTVLEGLSYKWRDFRVEESGGLVEGQSYFEGSGIYQSRRLAFNVTHADYFRVASFSSEGASAGAGPVSGFASAFQSAKSSGQAVGGNIAMGPIAVNCDGLFSGRQRQAIGIVTEHVRQFTVSQFVSVSAGHPSVSLGGGYTGNLLSANVGYQEVFVPNVGFQKALSIQVSWQFPRLTVNTAVNVLPTGVFYTGYGTAYIQSAPLAGGQTSPTAE